MSKSEGKGLKIKLNVELVESVDSMKKWRKYRLYGLCTFCGLDTYRGPS
ncbi:hypothetical protein [Algoriphagus sp. AK58]|nr:hypothetical protein [Algoriphagus sp. AK58]